MTDGAPELTGNLPISASTNQAAVRMVCRSELPREAVICQSIMPDDPSRLLES